VIVAHMPEAPTRLVKQLAQIMRGGCAIGLDRDHALHLALRCARDSAPPLRVAILECLATGHKTWAELTSDLGQPRTTVRRQVESLEALRLVVEHRAIQIAGKTQAKRYTLAEDVDPLVLRCPEKSSYRMFVMNKAS